MPSAGGLLGKAGQKLFEQHLEQYSPQDPLYETYTDERGKEKRRKRALPPGLSKRDLAILKSVNRRAHYLDKGFVLPCPCGNLRFGWTFLIGFIPIVGDVTDAALNYLLVVRKARQADIPDWLLRRMLFNNAISAGVGVIPLAGDVILAIWKANSRNARLLEEFLRIRGDELLKAQATIGGSTAPKDDLAQIKPGAGLKVQEKPSGERKGAVPASASTAPKDTANERTPSLAPGAAEAGSSIALNKGGSTKRSFSWFSGGSRKSKEKAPAAGERGRFVENVDSTAKGK